MTHPVTVTARLDSPVIEAGRWPIMLDSILAYARALTGDLPLLRLDTDPEIPLPLERWEDTTGWGWKVSQAHYRIAGYTTVEIRRKPAVEAMARYGDFKNHHLGLGPHKARDIRREAAWIHEMRWHAIATDVDQLVCLLTRVHGIGKHVSIGFGHVTDWQVSPSTDPAAWQDRGFKPGQRTRPPYWHPVGRAAA
ncbi:hypothetical protein [Brevibacterium otitidis]|uniref:Uncharacterized protein n=1 Tax=Brevibacterium otitidis TaxID=53364 RepID=A0ABV5X1W0_9MICO|nr:hypothetical protein GCM10023233_04620 [Brevibacterium otitidis]